MNSLAAQQYLDSFINREMNLGQVHASHFKLERVQQLLKELGDPHKKLKVIHVAGTKGKGSVCAIISSILQKAGYKAGLYTSPHINNFRERIRILESKHGSGIPNSDIFPDCITDEELCAVIDQIKPAIENIRAREDFGILSFFEVYTVLALYYFYKRKVDVAVLETGLGGRLDATNVVQSMIAVITPISIEHAHILGNTITQIAAEKAGIIKDCAQKVVIAPQDCEAEDVLKKRCQEFHIDPLWVDAVVAYDRIVQNIDGQVFDLRTPQMKYQRIHLPLLGKHQRENAATSICAVERLRDFGFSIPAAAVKTGCENVFWPGRLEGVARNPLVLLDGAHNAASARALSGTMREISRGKKIILVLGISKDKDKKSIIAEMEKISRDIIFTKANHPRASDLEGAVGVKTALGLARQKASLNDIILVTGSIFVVSEARRHLLSKETLCIK